MDVVQAVASSPQDGIARWAIGIPGQVSTKSSEPD